MSFASSDSEYDAFLSYRHREPEAAWVRRTLLPYLEADGLHVIIDYRDFVLGSPLITEMERGVTHSRYTVAVITPAYLESTFTEFENLLAQQLGLEEAARRLIIVMREPCTLSLRLRYLLWLDMSSDADFAETAARLVNALRQPPKG